MRRLMILALGGLATPWGSMALPLCFILCGPVFGANEIRAFIPGVTTAYYVIRGESGTIWYPVGQVFETYGTAGRAMADYDLALVDKSGDYFVGSFDTNVASGNYYWAAHYQTGGSPAEADPVIWAEYGNWTGSLWSATAVTAASIADSVWDEPIADHTGETTFGGELGTLDPNITAILSDTNLYDTDAEHAAAIWNALMATYTIELSFGGELQQLDPNVTSILANTVAIKAVTDIMEAVNSTVSVANDANSFTIANTGDINDVNDAYEGMTVYVKDATTGDWEARLIENWETGRVITVDTDFTFTPEVGDVVVIWGIGYMPPVIFNQFPLPRETTHTSIDRTAASGAATVTRDVDGLDP